MLKNICIVEKKRNELIYLFIGYGFSIFNVVEQIIKLEQAIRDKKIITE
jgi:hypothetical protein